MINILEGTDYTWSCDSDGGTPPANISGFLGLQVLQGVQGEYTIHPGKKNFISFYQDRIQEGLWGLCPPPGPVKSIDFRVFFRPQRMLSPHPMER